MDSIGQLLLNATGGAIKVHDQKIPITPYIMGDISSTIYPVNGGLEDWAYGAGWDFFGKEATLEKCEPFTYVLPNTIKTGKVAYKNVRSAIYIVETDGSKRPSERLLGSRQISKDNEGRVIVESDSVKGRGNMYDGHINRNIRLVLELLEAV
jgi:hypothetical protein